MKSSQVRLATAALIGLAFVALLLWWRAVGAAAESERAAATSEVVGSPTFDDSSVRSISELEPQREPAPAPREPEPPSRSHDGLFRLRVLHFETLAPVAGAEVRWVESDKLRDPDRSTFVFDPDVEKRWAEHGHHATSDANGEVWFGPPELGFQIEVTHGALWGNAWADRARGDRYDIVVHPDRELLVEVVDASGTPAAGVGVLVQSAVEAAHGFRPNSFTGHDGIARIRRLRGGALSSGEPVRVRLCTPSSLLVERVVATNPWPTMPVRLELPPTGSFLLKLVESSGLPNSQDALASLMAARDSAGFQLSHVWVENGTVEVPHVALGDTYSVSAWRVQTDDDWTVHREKILGPRRAGERVEVELVVERRGFTLLGSAVRPDGTPVTGVRVLGTIGKGAGFEGWAETDASGRFRLSTSVWNDQPGQSLSLLYPLDRLEANVSLPEHLSGERLDLGVVRLEEAPILVKGRVIDAQGQPIEGALVSSQVRPRGFDASRFPVEPGFSVVEWKNDPRAAARTGKDGRFALGGQAGDVDRRIRALADGFQEAPYELLAAGAREHTLVLNRSIPRLVGRVVLPTPAALAHLRLRTRGAKANWLLGGSFEILREREGPVDLEIHVDGESLAGDAPLVRLEGLESAADPRLDGIDLRPLLREFRFDIVPPPGVNIPTTRISAALPGTMIWSYDSGPSALVLIPAALVQGEPRLDVRIVPRGMRPVMFEGVANGARLELQPNTELKLRVPDHLPAASGDLVYSIVAILRDDELLRTRIVEGRTATLRLPKNGKWRVIWELESQFHNLTDVELEVGGEDLECVLDTTVEAIEAELARVRAARK